MPPVLAGGEEVPGAEGVSVVHPAPTTQDHAHENLGSQRSAFVSAQ